MAQSRSYPFYSALWNGFYNKHFYAHVALHWRGAGFAYLLLAVAVALVPMMVMFQVVISTFLRDEVPYVLEQMPEITIENGAASVEVEEPYVIYAPDKTPLMVIDTGGRYQTPEEAGAKILLHEREVIVHQNAREVRHYALEEVQERTVVTRETIEELVRVVKPWLLPGCFVFMLGAFYLFRLLQALLYAVFGMIIARILNVRLAFDALLQLAMVALTVPMLVAAVLLVVGASLPWFVTFGAAMFYLWFGIRASRDAVEAPVSRE